MSATDEQPRRQLRLGAFGWGLVAGATGPFLIPVILFSALKLWIPDLRRPEFNVDVVSVGADVSRHGGSRVVVANERGAVIQTCNDQCDDLRLRESSGDNSYWVRVFDKDGACVACTATGVYVTNGYGAPITRFDVAGAGVLQVRDRFLDADGSGIAVKTAPDDLPRAGVPDGRRE